VRREFKETRRGQTALMWAAADGNTAVVEELVVARSRYEGSHQRRIYALLFAVREGRSDTVRAMLESRSKQ